MKANCLKKRKRSDEISNPTTAYIIKGNNIPGKFHPEKAIALGIKPGFNFKKLVQGESVLSSTNKLVKSEDCQDPPRPGAIVIIVDCPNGDYVDSISNCIQFNEFYNSQNVCVFHLIEDSDVLTNPEYLSWMNKFSSVSRHFILNADYSSNVPIYNEAFNNRSMANLMNQNVFSAPRFEKSVKNLDELHGLPKNTFLGSNLLKMKLEPTFEFELDNDAPISTLKLSQNVIETVSRPSKTDDAFILPLGTGGSIPSGLRNVSSTLIILPSKSVILFDCGEATLHQITRYFNSETDDVLKKLSLIFISHYHSDHHLGLFNILYRWLDITSEDDSLVIVISGYLLPWISRFKKIFNQDYPRIKFIDSKLFETGVIDELFNLT